ncbi:MAG: SagB/ThcOx family dehydrogenase, partial [Alphaproteobacteria bacterium]|nr:SagB/ThcOx family dehydrogenase [Alphaproteobacteria bacterium]
ALDPLTAGAPVAEIGTAAGLDEPATRAFAGLLLNARVALPVDPETGATLEEAGPLSWWEFHDLLFHSRSRNGRFDAPYGGTYHRKGRDAPPAFLSPPPEAAPIPLPEPDAERLTATDPPFAAVMEARRSVRDYGDARLTIDQLGELLWRAARIRQRLATGSDDMDYSFRPHPGGGAIHELTLYPVVGACDGLERGVYQYDPEAHVLRRMPVAEADLDHMLEVAWITGDRKSRPQVQFSITARAERMQWKYQSMVYAVILKNVGALYQTLYLAATAMGLAPTALGGGDSDRFARATGLDYYAESLVGEFLVGAKP